MVIDIVNSAQHTMIRTLFINVAWCCDEPFSYVAKHLLTSILLHCLMLTARPFPLLAGRALWLPQSVGRLPFPQGPHTTPPYCPLQYCFMYYLCHPCAV
jgi:hypothetical protein